MSGPPLCDLHSHETPVCIACCYTDNSPFCGCECHAGSAVVGEKP